MSLRESDPELVFANGEGARGVAAAGARAIFDGVWRELQEERGSAGLLFPGEIFWLNGAPGSGKGTNTEFIMRERRYEGVPIVVSDLLHDPRARRLMDAGGLVGDREVLALLLRKLLDPQFRAGAVVDGFPRTQTQVDFLRMFFGRLNTLHSAVPRFHILVLFVDEEESVRRQLKRGREALASGGAAAKNVRKTDLDPGLARGRYRVFMEQTFAPLQTLRSIFACHLIEAHGSVDDVRRRIAAGLAGAAA
ncbi:MAG: nucleoside monophosphate kinase [Puniceicoccales bacterium]|jgi:adenylate kinase|nr:nucleoside monophosphate kinase [Puniceicoccales bacterium]